MTDFVDDVRSSVESLRESVSTLEVMLREVAWAAQDAMAGLASLPTSDDPRRSRESLALEYGARVVAPDRLKAAVATIDVARSRLAALVDQVIPPAATAIVAKPGEPKKRRKAIRCVRSAS